MGEGGPVTVWRAPTESRSARKASRWGHLTQEGQIMRVSSAIPPIIVMLLLAACSDGNSNLATPPVPSVPTGPSALQSVSVPDVSGSWNWKAEGHISFPPLAAPIFGIEPEGPITQMWCETSGTMELIQAGTTFSGMATRTSLLCETGGGRALVPPGGFPDSLPVADGLLTGRGVHFLFSALAGLGCPHNGAIIDLEGGRARTLSATGRCIVPGHPQSPAPLAPPPRGTSKDVTWQATRP